MDVFDLERPLRMVQNYFELSALNGINCPEVDHQRGEVSPHRETDKISGIR